MKLTKEQIKSAVWGAITIEDENGYLRFSRFSKTQAKTYKESTYHPRQNSSSGMRIVFKTNSKTFNIKGKMIPGGSRDYFAQDIFCDDKFIGSLQGRLKVDEYIYDETYILPEGEKTVTVYLPPLCGSMIKEIELEDGSSFTPVRRQKTILVYGDSITQGYDAVHPQNRYGAKLADLFEAEEYCQAIGGEKFCPWLTEEKLPIKPDYITVAYGTNHWAKPGMTYEMTKERAKEFFGNIVKHYKNAKIFAITPIWRNDYKEKPNFKEFADIGKLIADVVAEYDNITLIDGIDFVPHDIKYYSRDCVHPNDFGHVEFSKNIYKKISEML
ncbi:MAG: hypothetical protein IKF53_02840 [Clostridia bacterium]|nr:hypothetical protein [Clostridia bacterium]